MQVSIIIVNYNRFQLTCNCIRSVIEFTSGVEYEIILVDNNSTETDANEFQKVFPAIVLIKSNSNGGFSKANNLGIEKAKGEFILLLNNDTVLTENSIAKSLEYFNSCPGAGVLGCRMTYADGTVQYSTRKFRSISWELLDLFRFIPAMMSYEKRSKMMLGKYFNCERTLECDWVNGAFFLLGRKVVEVLPGGKLDETFFMYGEDQLWCWQIKQLGYKILFFAGTTIIHLHGGSSDLKKQLALRKTMLKNELRIMRIRKGRGLYYLIFAAVYGLKEGSRNVFKRIVFALSGRLLR